MAKQQCVEGRDKVLAEFKECDYFSDEKSTTALKEATVLFQSLKLPEKKVSIRRQGFRYGFSYYYGIFEDRDSDYICISPQEGMLLRWLSSKKDDGETDEIFNARKGFVWPLFDAENDEYFIPLFEKVKSLPPPSGSMPTDQHIDDLVRHSRYHLASYRELKSLTPYAKMIAECNSNTYHRVREQIKDFPYVECKSSSASAEDCIIS